jgi:vanillate O-demethylase monooxygenase subunit
MTAFLQNAWYMAAWSEEIGAVGQTLARRILDTPLVLFRCSDGSTAVLEDRCPHRFAPLSLGTVKGNSIECHYHGLCFDKTGTCTKNPQGPAPAAARVRAYVTAEQDGIVWIWPGAPERADKALIPRFPRRVDPTYRTLNGLSHVEAHYELAIDNLLDLTHISFLHPGFGGESWDPKNDVKQEGSTIWSNYEMLDFPNTDYGKTLFPMLGGNIDEYDSMRWNPPSTCRFDLSFAEVGELGKRAHAVSDAHILTPETLTSTHYFWSSSVPSTSPVTTEQLRALLIQAFDNEDKPMLERVQQSMRGLEFWSLNPVLLRGDNAAVRARRALKQLIEEERTDGVHSRAT